MSDRRRHVWITERSDLRESRVDRERCVIRDVKILGMTSKNGRRYTREAIRQAAQLYEGRKVKANHPEKPNAIRSVDDTLGWFEGIYEAEDGLYAREFHYLQSHPMSARIVEAADRNPDLFGFSHNIQGDTRDEPDGTETVLRITEVRSVDLVDEPATTGGLFEGARRMRLRDYFEALRLPRLKGEKGKARLKRLFEGGMMDADMDAPADTPPPDDAPADDHRAALTGGFEASLIAIVKAALAGEMDAKDALKKIQAHLKAHSGLTDDGSPSEPVEEEADDADDADEADDTDVYEEDDEDIEECDDKEDEGKKMREQKELRQLRAEKQGRQLCEQHGVAVDSALLEALAALPNQAARLRLVEREKAHEKARTRTAGPRSGVGGGKATPSPADDLGAFVSAYRG